MYWILINGGRRGRDVVGSILGCYIAKGLTICGLAGRLPIKRVVATPTT